MNSLSASVADETQPHWVYAPTPWSHDVWFVVHDGRCIGWIRRYHEGSVERFGVYTYGCDERGLRVWVAAEPSVLAAAGYIGAHVHEMLALSNDLAPDPVNPLGLHERV